MISLNDYIELLKTYFLSINEELQDILNNSKTNFDYQNITIKNVKIDEDNDVNIKLLIEQSDSKKYIYEIVTSKIRGIDSICYLEKDLLCAMMFYKFKIDNKTLKKIVDLILKYQDYFKCELTFENIMRKLRKIPDHLPFYNYECSKEEQEVLDTVSLDINYLPEFIQSKIENRKSK